MEAIGALGLDGDHGDVLPVVPVESLQDATQETGPADGGHDHVRFQAVFSDFVDQRTVAAPDEGVIEGMDVSGAVIRQSEGVFVGLIPGAALDEDLGAERADVVPGCVGGGGGDHDGDGNAKLLARVGNRYAGVPSRGGYQTPGALPDIHGAGEADAADLERARWLQGFHLEPDRGADEAGKGLGFQQWGLDMKGIHVVRRLC